MVLLDHGNKSSPVINTSLACNVSNSSSRYAGVLKLCTLTALLASSFPGIAQKNQQLWFDYQLDYPFGGQYLFEVTASYQTVLSDTAKWRSLGIFPVFEYQYLPRLDLISGIPVIHTQQTTTYNSFEISPYLGARFHISQNKRIESKLTLRIEERFFQNIESNLWEKSSRIRLKAEALIALNRSNLYQDKLWYTIFDYEGFIVMDEQVHERFANLLRGRFGLGYRLNYKNRFELIYTLQSSRDEIHGAFISNDNILQLKYKMYINPGTPKKSPEND